MSVIQVGEESYIEQTAIQQVNNTLKKYSNITKAVSMPDLHPGPGIPIGCAFASKNECYPGLIGSDIGCGMTLFEITKTKAHKVKIPKWTKNLEQLDLRTAYPNISTLIEQNGLKSTKYDSDMGSLGGGNHFAEFQMVEEILDQESFDTLNINEDNLLLLVHSGSRTFGQAVYESTKKLKQDIISEAKEIDQYLEIHDDAVKWAKANRMLVAHRITEHLNIPQSTVINIVHNYLQRDETEGYIHRKGVGYVLPGQLSIIPGSRGTFSYIVKMTEDKELAEKHLCSIAHGAGRRWNRSMAEKHAKSRYRNLKELQKTKLGSSVICASKSLLCQETPEAYKDIDSVIRDLEEAKLITVVAKLRPIITFKQ